MIDLSGRHVLVTGGSRGIGAAAARLFAKAGAAVMIHYRERESEARMLLDELFTISSREHLRFPCDFMEPSEIQELFQFVGQKWGRLDVLVNNAGVWVHNPMNQFSEERFISSLRINVRGPFLCLHHALPLLRLSKDAAVINIGSTAGQRGEAGYSQYAASKGGMIAMAKSLAVELAPEHITVNCVAPGWVRTDMTAHVLDDAKRRREIEKSIPVGRVGEPDEVAAGVVFLASRQASFITGAVLNINGGGVL